VESRGMGDLFALEQLLARYRPRHQGIRTYGGYGPVRYTSGGTVGVRFQ
jgi:hypothetical protein